MELDPGGSSHDVEDMFEELFDSQRPAEGPPPAPAEEADLFDSLFENGRRESENGGDSQIANIEAMEAVVAFPLPHSFGNPEQIRRLGVPLQVSIYNQYLRFVNKYDSMPDRPDPSSAANPRVMTSLVLDNFVVSSTMKSVAAVAEQTKKSANGARRYLLRCAGCMIYGSSWMVGTCLAAWRSMFAAGACIPVLLVHKFRYDETPLRMKLTEYNKFIGVEHPEQQTSLGVDSKYCKIFRPLSKFRRQILSSNFLLPKS